jgi:hypothetical protein
MALSRSSSKLRAWIRFFSWRNFISSFSSFFSVSKATFFWGISLTFCRNSSERMDTSGFFSPWHTKLVLGHKRISSTERYIHLEQMLYMQSTDKYETKVAHNVEEACALADVGFDYVTGEYGDGGKIFKRRK